jgi:hypothetical protein
MIEKSWFLEIFQGSQNVPATDDFIFYCTPVFKIALSWILHGHKLLNGF